jgi:hypothetical protein
MKPHRIILFRDSTGKWRYRVKAGNNRIVDASEQGFRSRWYATRRARRAWPNGVVEVAAQG